MLNLLNMTQEISKHGKQTEAKKEKYGLCLKHAAVCLLIPVSLKPFSFRPGFTLKLIM